MSEKEISKVVGQLTYNLRTNMTSVTRFVRMKREKHPTLTDIRSANKQVFYIRNNTE